MRDVPGSRTGLMPSGKQHRAALLIADYPCHRTCRCFPSADLHPWLARHRPCNLYSDTRRLEETPTPKRCNIPRACESELRGLSVVLDHDVEQFQRPVSRHKAAQGDRCKSPVLSVRFTLDAQLFHLVEKSLVIQFQPLRGMLSIPMRCIQGS